MEERVKKKEDRRKEKRCVNREEREEGEGRRKGKNGRSFMGGVRAHWRKEEAKERQGKGVGGGVHANLTRVHPAKTRQWKKLT